MKYFDFEPIARQAGISNEDLRQIEDLVRVEFPHDDMMWELHVLRVCMAIRDGHLTVDDVLQRKAA